MRVWIIIFSLFFIFGYACSYHTENHSIKKKQFVSVTDSIYFPFSASSFKTKMLLKEGQFVEWNGEKFFIALFADNHLITDSICFYSVRNRKIVHTIDLKMLKNHNFLPVAFHVFSKDSILLLLSSYNDRSFGKDTFLVIIDYNGNIKKSYPNNFSFASVAQWENTASNVSYQFHDVSHPLIFNNKLFFINDPMKIPSVGSDSFFVTKDPVFGYYDLKTDSIVLSPYWFPELKKGNYYPSGGIYSNISMTLNDKGNPVISFSYSSYVYEWDIKNNKLIPHRLSSNFIDSILPDKTPSSEQFSETEPCYFGIYYDMETGVYVRKLRFPKFVFGKLTKLWIFADKNFNYLGERLSDSYVFYRRTLICSSDTTMQGWECLPFKQSEYPDSFKLVKCVYNFSALDTSGIGKIIASEKNKYKMRINTSMCEIFGGEQNKYYTQKRLKKYLKNYCSITDTSYALFVLSSRGCPACNQEILNFFSINKNILFQHTNTYILFVDNSKSLKYFFSNYAFLKNNNHILSDTLNIYKEANPYKNEFMYNPRLILVRNGKIELDSIYSPNQITDGLLMRYLKFWSLDRE